MSESFAPNMGRGGNQPIPATDSSPAARDAEPPRPIAESTLGPPSRASKALWWMSYRVGRAMGKVLTPKPAKPHPVKT